MQGEQKSPRAAYMHAPWCMPNQRGPGACFSGCVEQEMSQNRCLKLNWLPIPQLLHVYIVVCVHACIFIVKIILKSHGGRNTPLTPPPLFNTALLLHVDIYTINSHDACTFLMTYAFIVNRSSCYKVSHEIESCTNIGTCIQVMNLPVYIYVIKYCYPNPSYIIICS